MDAQELIDVLCKSDWRASKSNDTPSYVRQLISGWMDELISVRDEHDSHAANGSEKSIQNKSLLAVGKNHTVLAWRQHVGKYRHLHQQKNIISVGVPGMADSMMVVAVTITPEMVGRTVGVAVAAEFKAAKGRQSDAQKKWQRAFESRGGVYRLVRSPEEMTALVDDVQSGRAFEGAGHGRLQKVAC